jgi:hypothetical protein
MRSPRRQYVRTTQTNKRLVDKGWQIPIEPLKVCNKATNANQVDDGNNVSNMLGGAFQATGVGGLESRYCE